MRGPVVIAVLVAVSAAFAQEGRRPPTSAAEAPTNDGSEAASSELTEEAHAAIQRGLERLALMQNARTGRWSGPDTTGAFDVAVTSVAGLAFLGAGESPGRGRFGQGHDPVRKAIEFVLRTQFLTGENAGLFYDSGGALTNADRPMHGHGFALLFLAEAYGQVASPELRQKMHAAIRLGCQLTARAQSRAGGWFYLPGSQQDEGSVTVTQIQGLRAARNAGIETDRAVIQKAVEYIRRSQDRDGGIRYTITHGETTVALTAAGMAVLYGAGEYAEPALDKGFAYLRLRTQGAKPDPHRFYFYAQLYLSQAMHQRGGPDWAGYFPQTREELLRKRGPDGTWTDPYVGKPFGTACACLVLEVPLRYLPIFQR